MIHDDDRHIPVKLCYGGGATPRFANGGLAHAASAVADAGRYGDEMVVHLNRREFEELRQRWGEPHINPDTGLPEFWNLKDLWHDVKDYVAPIGAAAAGAFLPVIGETVGSYLPGVADMLGSTGMQALSTGLLGAGAGYLIDGGKGALMGGLGGALGSYGGDFLRNGSTSALGSVLGGTGTLGSAASSLLGGASSVDPITGAQGSSPGLGSKAIGPALLMAALNLGSGLLDNSQSDNTGKKAFKDAQNQNEQELPTYVSPRKRIAYQPGSVPDYTTQGERVYFDNNQFADGGHVGYVHNTTGDNGRSDKIKALLSPNEYVIDAETTALLGDGSPEAGAKRLDQMRAAVRAHKGSALAHGQISPDALHPLQYMGMQ